MYRLYLKEQILTVINNNKEQQYWEQIINYDEKILGNKSAKENQNNNRIMNSIILRQDEIDYGCKAQYKNSDLFVSRDTGFDASQSYELNEYLTELLITSHNLNDKFQHQIKYTFEQMICLGKYQSAPVKLAERCIIKG